MSASYTPMIRQYLSIKNANKDAILFFRLGDFYEMFFDDAKVASRILDLTLTAREGGNHIKVPMAGIPYHAAENYVSRLVRAGHKVAICEQVEDPKVAKGVVKREVVRTLTPGTTLSSSILEQKDNNYIASAYRFSSSIGIARVDVSTGEFIVGTAADIADLSSHISRYRIKEVLLPESESPDVELAKEVRKNNCIVTYFDSTCFIPQIARRSLEEHLRVHSLEGLLGADVPDSAIGAAGGVLAYLKEMHREALRHISTIRMLSLSDHMIIDAATERNLELVRNLRNQGREHTLISVIDDTLTAMGGRLLRSWILSPLIDKDEIDNRLEHVDVLLKDPNLRNSLRSCLSQINDIERIIGRLECGLANARDLLGLSNSIKQINKISDLVLNGGSNIIKELIAGLPCLDEAAQTIDEGIREDAPLSVRDGHMIRDGYSRELDEIKAVANGGKEWIRDLQKKEIERTGVRSLKVRYNKVFGYYIELTKSNLGSVPEDYIRKQTLVNAERFITPELKEKEALVLGAQEKMTNLEYEIFASIRDKVREHVSSVQKAARIVAHVDVFSGLAEVALKNKYVRPAINPDLDIDICEGRHPVVEEILEDISFVPNDACLNDITHRLLVITGPNMSGKSTYIRQVALIVLMAQIGCFVPAKSASIGLVDRIFTRVGATDELTRGQSTFMVEMVEVANILNNATRKSLLILDEVGRGTSTFDGVSIAWAVAEHIHDESRLGARALFATHYHELAELELLLDKVKNYNIAVKEWSDEIIFLRKIVRGGTDKSYGIHVARLAGLPAGVIDRAKEILANLEKASIDEKGLPSFAGEAGVQKHPAKKSEQDQLTFFQELKNPVVEKIEKADINNMTPMQALQFLEEVKKEAKKITKS